MQEFATLYQESPEAARHKYYLEKCHFETSTEEGLMQRKKMMKKYLEGLQWVLYYYYAGVPHWRFYYPYHYAPMIVDLGTNIVASLLDS